MSMNAAVFLGILTLLTGCATGGSPEANPSASASNEPSQSSTRVPDSCEDEFKAVLLEDPDGTPGVEYLELTNVGSAECTITGIPTLTLLDATGTAIGTMSQSDAYGRAATPQHVAPGKQAYVWFHVVDAANVNGECGESLNVSGIATTLAKASEPIVVGKTFDVCTSDALMTDVQVGPVDSEPRPASKGY